MKCARVIACVAALTGLLPGCVFRPQFEDKPVVWKVQDARNIPEPEEREFYVIAQSIDWFLLRRSTRALELHDKEPAHNTNALDEVPDSTWFTNRIGVRRISPEEAARGPAASGPPIPPLVFVSGKSGGANPGMIAKDSTGRTFVVKFDTKDNPEMQTGVNTIVNRIFWTLGYNVPSDTLFTFYPEQLTIAPGAKVKDEYGNKHPATQADIDHMYADVPRFSDGHYRASASEFIDGVPKGGWSAEGTRPDDPNDVVPHEHRRELRGLRVFAAWLNHTDMKEDNSYDAYVEEDGKHFLRHYLLDFGEALGSHAAEKGRYEDGYEHLIDWEKQGKATVAFGLWVRPWEHLRETRWPSVGAFTSNYFDPVQWTEAYPYWPFWEADEADSYWGAKLVLRFDRKILRAIVNEAQLSDPEAAKYLVDTLYERGRAVGRAYVQSVTALDNFTITPQELCAIDLTVYYRLVTSGLVQLISEENKVLWERVVEPSGRVCMPIPQNESYHKYRIRVRRRSETTPVMQLHFVSGKNAHVVGVVRVEP